MEMTMNVKDVAALLKVPDRSVYRLVKAGKLRARRVGRLMRFLKNDVEAMLHG